MQEIYKRFILPKYFEMKKLCFCIVSVLIIMGNIRDFIIRNQKRFDVWLHGKCPLLQCGSAVRPETVSRTPFCSGRVQWKEKHTGQHQPHAFPAGCDTSVQLPFSYRIYVSGAETANWGILLPLLFKIYAKAEPLPEEKRSIPTGAGH